MKLTEKDRKEIIKKYLTGKYSGIQLATEYNVSRTTILTLLRNNNVKIERSNCCRKYSLNQNYFDVIDTEGKAYFLGLLYADGCVYKNRITLGLQDKDKYILEVFNKDIQSNKPIENTKSSRYNKNWQDVYRLSICGEHICNKVIDLGCFRKKSLILKFPTEQQVPSRLVRHFVRGYFDGDGSFSDINGADGYKRYLISIISTLDFCKTLQEHISGLLNVNSPTHPHENGKTTTYLRISGRKQCVKFLDWLYKDATIFFNRKYERYLSAKDRFCYGDNKWK